MPLPRTLPASWYTSDHLIDLARQYVFGRGWLFVCSVLAFARLESEASQFDFIGKSFFVLNDANVENCDHITAYYGCYTEVMDGLSESQRNSRLESLDKVTSYTTENGLFFVSHESNPVLWQEFYGPELQDIIKDFDFRHQVVRDKLTYHGLFSFLTYIDGYQECLHCAYAHPGFRDYLELEAYRVENFKNFSRHYSYEKGATDQEEGLFLYFFPSSTLSLYKGGLETFRCNPIDGNNCRLEFEYCFDGSDEEYKSFYQFARQVATEDQRLCEECQKNLKTGMYSKGVLNPEKENGVIYYQDVFRRRIMEGLGK